MNQLCCPSYSGEYAGTLCFFIMSIHCYRKLFAYFTPTEVIPTYLLLVVNQFEVGSVNIVELGIIEGLEIVND